MGKTLTHQEYLASNVWKCAASPTGAHHWIEIQHAAGEYFHTGLWYCKYCNEVKSFPKEWNLGKMFTVVGLED